MKKFFVTAVALAAFTACSDSNLADVDSVITDPASGIQSENSAVLTDANGQKVSSVSADFGTYYMDIKTDNAWLIETNNINEFVPTRQYGRGSMRVPMLVGNNWAQARELSYKVYFFNENGKEIQAGTRAAGDGGQTVNQQSNTNLAAFKNIVNSNIYVGYGYNPTKGTNAGLWTGIEIFKMDDLSKDTTLVKSSLLPDSQEKYIYAHSEAILDKVIGVSASPGGNFGPVRFDTLGVTVNTSNINHSGTTVMQKSLIRSIYSRELKFAEAIINSSAQFDESKFTNGFKYYKKRFIDQYNAEKDTTKRRAIADEFFNVVGTHFVVKALLGQELNYRINVDSSKTKKSTEVKVALDFKWQQQVKDTTDVDSLTKARVQAKLQEWAKDPTKQKSFVLKTGVEVTDVAYNAANSTKASVKARGGDVELVSILATGGSLVCEDLQKWLLSTDPEKAAMVGVDAKPIYELFDPKGSEDEKRARNYLKELNDTYLKVDEKLYGIIGDDGTTK